MLAARNVCVEKAKEIFAQIGTLADAYRKLYEPVQKFIEGHRLAKEHFRLTFETAITPSGFVDGLLANINQARKGSFCGASEGRAKATSLCHAADFNSPDGLDAFLRQVLRCLECDSRSAANEAVSLSDQLAKGCTANQAYNFIFSLDYLRPTYTLQWAAKEIAQLSPGERGTLLLVFYLLIDRSDIPLIMDQPEENLDNQTVYDVLVPSLKEAKSRRQIVLVTHNPNLAVVCDADQVIYCSLNKNDGQRIGYDIGAIENPVINKHLVDILEGTWPAFDNRGSKYHPLTDVTEGASP